MEIDNYRKNLLNIYKLELQCIPHYAQMELFSGVTVDLPFCKRTLNKVSKHLEVLYKLLNLLLPGYFYPVSVQSSPKMKMLLYHEDYLNIPLSKYTCIKDKKYRKHESWLETKLKEVFSDEDINRIKVLTGYDTILKIIESSKKNPDSLSTKSISILKYLALAKKLERLRNVFSKVILADDSKIHFELSPTQVSGRISTSKSKPCLNLSHNPDIKAGDRFPYARSMVVAPEGHVLIFADFKNEEVRILLVELLKYIKGRIISYEKEIKDNNIDIEEVKICIREKKPHPGKKIVNGLQKCQAGLVSIQSMMEKLKNGLCPVSLLINEYYQLGYSENELGLNGVNLLKKNFPELRMKWKSGFFFATTYGQSRASCTERLEESNQYVLENRDSLNIKLSKSSSSISRKGFIVPKDEIYQKAKNLLKKHFPYMMEFLSHLARLGTENFFICSPDGRIRFFDNCNGWYKKSKIGRISKNHKIQAFGSHVIKKLLLRFCNMYPIIDSEKTGVKLLLLRHDEVVIECREELADKVCEDLMEIVVTLNLIDLKVYGYSKDFMLEMELEKVYRWSEKG